MFHGNGICSGGRGHPSHGKRPRLRAGVRVTRRGRRCCVGGCAHGGRGTLLCYQVDIRKTSYYGTRKTRGGHGCFGLGVSPIRNNMRGCGVGPFGNGWGTRYGRYLDLGDFTHIYHTGQGGGLGRNWGHHRWGVVCQLCFEGPFLLTFYRLPRLAFREGRALYHQGWRYLRRGSTRLNLCVYRSTLYHYTGRNHARPDPL